jgi:hypothetical protein
MPRFFWRSRWLPRSLPSLLLRQGAESHAMGMESCGKALRIVSIHCWNKDMILRYVNNCRHSINTHTHTHISESNMYIYILYNMYIYIYICIHIHTYTFTHTCTFMNISGLYYAYWAVLRSSVPTSDLTP